MSDPAALRGGAPGPGAGNGGGALPADARAPVDSGVPSAQAGTGPLLRTEGLTRHFKIGNALSRRNLHAVDDVTLTIGEHEIVALAGESGSGKSTVARLLAKLYKPTSGEIYFQGRPLSGVRGRREVLRYRRSEERRVGKECRARGNRCRYKKKER